ncbi:MAG: ribosome-associated translation inhibitor RaiA [Candidatus Eisenbacteria bacterium]
MQISITARQCEISSGVRQFAQQRIEKLEKYASDIHGAHVIVTQEHGDHVAEITLRLNGTELVAKQEAGEAGAAIERATDRLEEQLRRHKDRRANNKHRAEKTPGGDAAPVTGDDEFDEDSD